MLSYLVISLSLFCLVAYALYDIHTTTFKNKYAKVNYRALVLLVPFFGVFIYFAIRKGSRRG